MATRKDDGYSFSCDFSGNKKIFYYWVPGFWVVSNSIFLIAEYLKKKNISIRPNYSQLSVIGVEKCNTFNQLYSVNTFIEGVKLLPIGVSLDISKNNFKLTDIKNTTIFYSYRDGLLNFINVWVSRLSGLLNNGVEIQSDLTGGADSRTVFSLLKKSYEFVEDTSGRIILRSSTILKDNLDLEIATNIANTYGMPINEKPSVKIQKFSGMESFYSWKGLCLGVYHPIYFPNNGPNYNTVRLGGAGAENHRRFYNYKDIRTFKEVNANKMPTKYLSYEMMSDLDSEFNRMSYLGSEIDPLILHYREYRNRMHSGRTPQYTVLFNPLGSKILEAVSEVAGKERIDNGQINYDLMATLLPDVLDIPFDHESKSFNEKRRQNLTVVNMCDSVTPGNVYIDYKEDDYLRKSNTKSAIQLLNDEFQNVKNNPFVKDFFGNEFIKNAESTMKNALDNNKFPHAINAQGIVSVIAAALFY